MTIRALTLKWMKRRKALKALMEAVRFYANHNHWMQLTENSGTHQLLVAHGNSESFQASKDGWSMAEWALRVVGKGSTDDADRS